MALKAVHVSDVPSLDHVPADLSLCCSSSPSTSTFPRGVEARKAVMATSKETKLMVVGHRGHGMNLLNSPDRRMRPFMENTILSFNSAANQPLDFIEFNVQVTRDDCPVIFHDDVILPGYNREPGKAGKSLFRKTRDGKIVNWDVEMKDVLCTLQESFQKIEPSPGFNIELKFDDHIVYQQDYLIRVLQTIQKVVIGYADQRPVIFFSFNPDVAILVRKL